MDFLLNIPYILSFPNTCQMKCLPQLTYNLHLSQLYQPWGLSLHSPQPLLPARFAGLCLTQKLR